MYIFLKNFYNNDLAPGKSQSHYCAKALLMFFDVRLNSPSRDMFILFSFSSSKLVSFLLCRKLEVSEKYLFPYPRNLVAWFHKLKPSSLYPLEENNCAIVFTYICCRNQTFQVTFLGIPAWQIFVLLLLLHCHTVESYKFVFVVFCKYIYFSLLSCREFNCSGFFHPLNVCILPVPCNLFSFVSFLQYRKLVLQGF